MRRFQVLNNALRIPILIRLVGGFTCQQVHHESHHQVPGLEIAFSNQQRDGFLA